jgi:hypothetical protein
MGVIQKYIKNYFSSFHKMLYTVVIISVRKYWHTSVHELNSFLKVIHKPKLFSPWELM